MLREFTAAEFQERLLKNQSVRAGPPADEGDQCPGTVGAGTGRGYIEHHQLRSPFF